MCGRYAFATSKKKLEKQFKVGNLNGEPPKNYNVAPTQAVPILRMQEDKRCELSLAHWGLVPFWAKDKKMAQYTINARTETIREKPSFRHCIRRQRCIIPASGFFEWHTLGQLKQPHYISMIDQSLMAMAGLWDKWEGPEGILESCTIITTTANSFMQPIHHRMPVFLNQQNYYFWLDTSNEHPDEILRQPKSKYLQSWPVSSAVGNVRHNSPDLIAPVN